MVGTAGHYALAMMDAMQYLYTLTIATAQMYRTLLKLLGTHLHINEIETLLLGERTHGQ